VNLGIYLYEQSEELDWAGPWEVLSAWARRWPDDGVSAFTIADSTEPVLCAKGLRVLADHTWETAPHVDVIVVPGGNATGPSGDAALHERLREISGRDGLVTSVCTGSSTMSRTPTAAARW